MTTTQTPDQTAYQVLPLKDVHPDPNQPRKNFEAEALQSLADSIKAVGVIQPVVVRVTDDGKTVIVDGERRYRASKLAKVKTIPVITRVDPDEDPATTLIKQVAANQHENLQPLEMAEFFDQLVTRHDVKIGKIPELLEAHGIKKIDRSAVSNLINLPAWAKDFINEGTLTPSHGKIILQAKDHPQIMARLQTGIEQDINVYKEAPTVDDLAGLMPGLFDNYYRDIQSLGFDRPEFDIETCKGCKTCKRFNHQGRGDMAFCLDEKCFDEKQAAATAERESQENHQQGQQADNDQTGGDIATESNQSDAAIAQAAGRIERTQQHLDEWLRGQLKEHLIDDEATKYAMLLWIASGAPGNYYNTCMERIKHPACVNDYDITRAGIDSTLKQMLDHETLLNEICNQAVDSITRENLRKLAHHCGITLDGNYIVTREYLEIKTKGELLSTMPPPITMRYDNGYLAKLPKGEIIVRALDDASDYGVPDDLAGFYQGGECDD